MLPRLTRSMLPGLRANARIEHIDHHLAHAAGAWRLSGFERALCLTADGMGDGLSFTVSRCSPDRSTRTSTSGRRSTVPTTG